MRSLQAELAAFRATLPRGASSYLALAGTRKAKNRIAKTEPAKTKADDSSDSSAEAEPAQTADNRGVEDQDGGYRLNFEDADVKDVLQAVIGRVLGLTYTIAPNVAGKITISSSATQSRSELLATLETVLAMQNLSLTRSGSTYRVAPISVRRGHCGRRRWRARVRSVGRPAPIFVGRIDEQAHRRLRHGCRRHSH